MNTQTTKTGKRENGKTRGKVTAGSAVFGCLFYFFFPLIMRFWRQFRKLVFDNAKGQMGILD